MGFKQFLKTLWEDPPPPPAPPKPKPPPSPKLTYIQNVRSTPTSMGGVLIGMCTDCCHGGSVGKARNADGHVLVVGGAGSGKSTCIAIPTLKYSWKAPALVVDIKGELYARSNRRNAYVFNPMNANSIGYDPFYTAYNSTHPIADIHDIALMLLPLPPTIRDPFWILSAQNILTAHLLYTFKHGGTFLNAIETLLNTDPLDTLEIVAEDHQCRPYVMQCLNLPETTLSGVMQTLSTSIMLFATDPYIRETLTSHDIITPELLEQGYDVFLQLPQHKLKAWSPLTSLIVQQFLRHFEQREEYNRKPILFMLDEFPALGKMDTVVNGLATLRSKKITIVTIVQSLAQLDATYGTDERKVICDNCAYKAILRATDADTQKYFSALVGTEERIKQTINYKDGLPIKVIEYMHKGWDTSIIPNEAWQSERTQHRESMSQTTEEKPIINPEDFAYLQDIVYLDPTGWSRLQKVPYWEIG